MASNEPLSLGQIAILCGLGVALFLGLKECSKPSPRKESSNRSPTISQSDGPNRVLATPTGVDVIVFTSKQAHSEAMRLINASADTSLLFRYIACIVPSGTSAVATERGIVVHQVVVSAGPSAGCRGVVASEFLR